MDQEEGKVVPPAHEQNVFLIMNRQMIPLEKKGIFSIFRGEIRLPKSPRLRKSPPPQLFEMILKKDMFT
jgi:hypothetical protein